MQWNGLHWCLVRQVYSTCTTMQYRETGIRSTSHRMRILTKYNLYSVCQIEAMNSWGWDWVKWSKDYDLLITCVGRTPVSCWCWTGETLFWSEILRILDSNVLMHIHIITNMFKCEQHSQHKPGLHWYLSYM